MDAMTPRERRDLPWIIAAAIVALGMIVAFSWWF
jgi:hypothetical protein